MQLFGKFKQFVSNKYSFTFVSFFIYIITNGQKPNIDSFSPLSGNTGISVNISGTNFGLTPSDNIVFFGAVRANVTNASANSLTVTVPLGATYSSISITVQGLTGNSKLPFIVTFSGGGYLYQTSFQLNSAINTNSYPSWITASDLDGDSKSDVIIVNSTSNSNGSSAASNTVSIYRNTTTTDQISFAPKIDSLIGYYGFNPSYVTAEDLDGDGKRDLIIAQSQSIVSILKNTSSPGHISFEPFIDFILGYDLRSISVSDIDGDGKPDIAVLDNNTDSLSIFRNTSSTGTISFSQRISIAIVGKPNYDESYQLISGDIDQDGKPDLIAISKSEGNNMFVFRNTSTIGSVSFAPSFEIAMGFIPGAVSIGDIDGDQKPDIAVINSWDTTVSVYRNNGSIGSISFATRNDFKIGSDPASLSIGDIDGDGKPDLVIACVGIKRASILKNSSTTGNISFEPGIDYYTGTTGPLKTVLGDLNSDGLLDIIYTFNNLSYFSVLTNKVREPTILSFNPSLATTGDVVTITGTNFTSANAVTFGGVSATSFTIISPTEIRAVVATGASGSVEVTTTYGKVSKPGFNFTILPDIFSFNPSEAGSGTSVTISGKYLLAASSVSFGGVPATTFTVVSPDTIVAVVASGASGSVSVTTPFGTVSKPGFIYNQVPKIISFSPQSGPIGTIVTITGENFNIDPAKNIVRFGAVNGEVITSSSTSVTVKVPIGATYQPISLITNFYSAFTTKPFRTIFEDGNSTFDNNFFQKRIDSVVGSEPSGIAIADFDRDGKIDIAVAVSQIKKVLLFRNTSTPEKISYKLVNEMGTGGYVEKIIISDINSDGKPDIILPGSNLPVFTNISTPGNILFNLPAQLANNSYASTAVADIDLDGRPDIAICIGNAVTIYRNTSTNGIVSFIQAGNFFGENAAHHVAISDLNADGKPDLVMTNQGSQSIAVLRNISTTGNINFASSANYTTGSSPVEVEIADFDNDGYMDIVTSNYSDSSISVFRNITSGVSISFAPKIDFRTGSNPIKMAIADFNGDGLPDIGVANRYDSSISVLKNISSTGLIKFDPHAIYRSGIEPLALEASDCDGDGLPDLISANYISKTISFFRNQNSRPVIQSISPDLGTVGTNVVIAGFNFNGTTKVTFGGVDAASFTVISPNKITAIAGEGLNGDVSVITAKGQALFSKFSFAPPIITSFSPLYNSVGKKVDIIGKNFSVIPSNNIVYFGPVRAQVTAATTTQLSVVVPISAAYGLITVSTHRLKAYSKDFFIPLFNNNNIPFSDSSFTKKFDIGLGSDAYSTVIKDFDNDGKPDLVVPGYRDQRITILRNVSDSGSLSFNQSSITGNFLRLRSVNSGDFDNDGKPDIVVTDFESQYIYLFRNNSTTGNISFEDPIQMEPGDNDPRHVTINDIDGDGKDDIVVSNSFNSFTVIRNITEGGIISFAKPLKVYVSNLPVYAALGDLDNDGLPDLVTSNNTNQYIGIMKNTSTPGNISFKLISVVSINGTPWGVSIGDLNNDGKNDIVFTNDGLGGGGTLMVLKNTTSNNVITFANPITLALDWVAYSVSIGDVNGDGKPDIIGAVTDRGIGEVSVFRNTSSSGSLSFDAKQDFPTGLGPYDIHTSDMDGDGRTDIITANIHSTLVGSISILLNNMQSVVTPVPPIPESEIKIKVSPNPFKDQINLLIEEQIESVSIKLTDMNGDVLYSSSYTVLQAGSSVNIINNSLSPGYYFLIIKAKNGLKVVKMIKL